MKQKNIKISINRKKISAEAKNKAENMIYELEKTMNESKTLNEIEKGELTQGISELRNSLNSNNSKEIEEKIQKLQSISSKIFYSGQQKTRK